jgi:hypothetical protein
MAMPSFQVSRPAFVHADAKFRLRSGETDHLATQKLPKAGKLFSYTIIGQGTNRLHVALVGQ